MLPSGISTRIVHPRYLGISQRYHINRVISTSIYHRSGLGEVDAPSTGYTSRSHLLICSVQRWGCTTDSFSKICHTDPPPPLRGDIVIDPKGCGVGGYRSPGGWWFFPLIQHGVITCDLCHICLQGIGALTDEWQYHLFRTVYQPLRSGFPIYGSNHAPISSTTFYACGLDSTWRYPRTAFGSVRAAFLLCCGLQWRATSSSIN